MRAGLLRHRISIQTDGGSQNSHGEVVPSWGSAISRWARIQPLRGAELLAAQQIKGEVTHKITMRYDVLIVSSKRILFNSRVFDINSVLNVDEKGETLELLCKESVS